MIKAQFSKEKLNGYGLVVGFEFANVKVQHPYRSWSENQPTFTFAFRVWKWQFYFMVYKPANLKLNRKERRANKFN